MLEPGSKLSHFEILSPLGRGGMGEVWRARDTKLGRDVAIKTLPEEFARDADRLARFEREAKLLASLNHPNIAAIFGLEEHDGMRFLVLELVEGDTLADRIQQGAIPAEECLKLALQIAEALEAAHNKGVLHRDLKPANIKVTPEGKVKVLDFGLAKAFAGNESDVGLSNSPTLSMAATQAGVILGTAAYMSPEQARAKAVDRRSDIWSFGVVLFEMLTASKAFPGDDVSQTLARVIDRDPDWVRLPKDAPARLHQTIAVCLKKDPRQRFGDITSARLALEGVFEPSPSEAAPVAAAGSGWRRPVRLGTAVLTGILAIVLIGAVVWQVRRPALPPVQIFTEPLNGRPDASGKFFDVSPDGMAIAYAASGQLQVRRLDTLKPSSVVPDGVSSDVEFSPDGRSLLFFDLGNRSLKRVAVEGGPVDTVCKTGNVRGISWGSDGTIVFGASGDGLWRVPARGGEPERLTKLDLAAGERNHVWPDILPGGKAVLYTIVRDPMEESQVAVLSLETLKSTPLFRGTSPRYVSTGHLVYAVGNSLRAVRFDLKRLETVGEPKPVLEGVLASYLGVSQFRLSDNGTLLYLPVEAASHLSVVWVDRSGRATASIADGVFAQPRLSPDGRLVAFGRGDDEGRFDVWLKDLESGREVKVTDNGLSAYPLWPPGVPALTLTFGSSAVTGTYNVYSRQVDLSGDVQLLVDSERDKNPGSWTPDGKTLVYYELSENGVAGRDIWTVTRGGRPTPLIQTRSNERSPRLSPNGRWLAYLSDRDGEDRLYVQRFPDLGPVIPVSTGRASEPVWSRDGRELFYRDGTQMWAVKVTTDGEFRPGNPMNLFDDPFEKDPNGVGNADFDVAPDGRFLMVAASGEQTGRLILVQNWFQELKRLVPVK